MRASLQEKPSRPVLRYHGGKWLLADWIISHFPPHKVYVEPFGGAASVLLRKPRACAEIYNDLDGQIVTLFRVLRNPAMAAELSEMALLTPYSRKEFMEAFRPSAEDVEQARRVLIQSFMGRGVRHTETGAAKGFRTERVQTAQHAGAVNDWETVPERIASTAARLIGVEIENRPALHVINARDSEATLFYVDPPYPHSTRYLEGKQKPYRFEMSDDEHRELAATLKAVKGMVALSGYDCELYSELYGDWYRVEREALAGGARPRTEVLWLNASAQEKLESIRTPLFAEG